MIGGDLWKFIQSNAKLDFGKQFVLFSVTFLEKVVDAKLILQSRTMVVDILNSFALD
jgi:hypothetical protein